MHTRCLEEAVLLLASGFKSQCGHRERRAIGGIGIHVRGQVNKDGDCGRSLSSAPMAKTDGSGSATP